MENDTNEYPLSPIQNTLIKVLERMAPITRRDIVKRLDTPRTTIYDNLLKLKKRGIVETYKLFRGNRGRPLVMWKLKD